MWIAYDEHGTSGVGETAVAALADALDHGADPVSTTVEPASEQLCADVLAVRRHAEVRKAA